MCGGQEPIFTVVLTVVDVATFAFVLTLGAGIGAGGAGGTTPAMGAGGAGGAGGTTPAMGAGGVGGATTATDLTHLTATGLATTVADGAAADGKATMSSGPARGAGVSMRSSVRASGDEADQRCCACSLAR